MKLKYFFILVTCIIYLQTKAQKIDYTYNFGIKAALNYSNSIKHIGYNIGFTNAYYFNNFFIKSDILFGNYGHTGAWNYYTLLPITFGHRENIAPKRYILFNFGPFFEYPYGKSSLFDLNDKAVLDVGFCAELSYQIKKIVFGLSNYYAIEQSQYSISNDHKNKLLLFCIFRFN